MKTRIITSIIIVAIAVPIFVLSGTAVYPIVLALVSGFSLFELLRVLGFEKKLPVAIPSYLIAVALPPIAYFSGDRLVEYVVLLGAVLYAYLLYLLFLSVFSKGKLKFTRMAGVFCIVTYVTLAFAALCAIRSIENGAYFFGIIFICSWVSDVFAFFTGVLFGKHKLIPEISPKKTVEGCIGGIVFATAAMLVYGLIVDLFFDHIQVRYLVLGLMGLVLSAISQVGDLVASSIKREEGVKDYGTLLPGHGGITDRFDSIYAIAVLALIICVLCPPFLSIHSAIIP